MNPVRSFARRRPVAFVVVLLFAVGTIALGAGAIARAQQQAGSAAIDPSALAQIDALIREKASRTPAQRKLDSRLLYAVKMARGEALASGVTALQVSIPHAKDGNNTDIDNRVILDVRAEVSDQLQQQLKAMGIDILDASVTYSSLRLAANLDQIETIAGMPDVSFIQPKQEALTSRLASAPPSAVASPLTGVDRPRTVPRKAIDRDTLRAAVLNAITGPGANVVVGQGQGSKESEGDTTHRAFSARGTFHGDGTGVKIGVLSDDVCSLAQSQALGDLGPVTVLPGMTGSCPGGDEGTAMLEIIHDLAPGAQLYFATAFISATSFAQNIRDLRTAGCDIIVDDIFYFNESPFQDGQSGGVISPGNAGVIAQAVKDVTAAGALYFSAAGNEGNLDAGTSGTWEGDFLDGGPVAAPLPSPAGSRLHSFGALSYNVLTASGGNANVLFWSDPLGASGNDYDLFVLNSTGTTVQFASTNMQTGTQDPFEIVNPGAAGNRLVIVKSAAAAARFLHLGTIRGTLTTATAGETHGHSAVNSANSFGVAATPAAVGFGATPAGPYPNPFNSANVVESFSSNGPRRIFYQSNGTAITPGNVSSTGGLVLNKPDITAADGTSVTGVGGFPSPFYGTSAAAPHAAAIAGLLKSANPALTATQISTALISSALDIQGAGVDRNSGAGILQAYQAMQAAPGVTGTAFLAADTIVATENPGNGDGAISIGEGAKIVVPLVNLGVATASGITATLTTSTTGVSLVLPATASYGTLAAGASASNTGSPFLFTLTSAATCPLIANFTLTLTYAGGGSPQTLNFSVATGKAPFTISTTLDGVAPATAPAGGSAATGLQTSRLTRDGVASACSPPKANPGLLAGGTGTRQYDAYTFNTCPGSVASCATVTLTQPSTTLFTVGYKPSFTPANPSTNYAGDPGVSGASTSYSFPVNAGAGSFVVTTHEVNSGGGIGAAYTLTVSGACAGTCGTPNQVPVAIAQNVTVSAPPGGTAPASINNGSFDPDGDPITLTQNPPGPYPIGVTSVRLTVTDNKGAASQATANVTVTSATPPTTVTGVATAIGATSATLNGTANPNGAATTARFEYGLTTGYGSLTPSQAMGSGSAAVAIGGGAITGLTCNTLYHFRATATSAQGTANGADNTFTTTSCTPQAYPGFVYALDQRNGDSNLIYGFGASPLGTLTPIPGFPTPSGGLGGTGSFSEHMAYDNGLLYVINDGSASLSVFLVGSTGALTPAPYSPIALGGSLACVAANPVNNTVVVGSDAGLWGLVVTPTTASIGAGSPASTGGANPFSCGFSRDGNYAYTGGNTGTSIAGFAVAPSTGALTGLAGSPFDTLAANPVGYATDSAGRLFTSNFGTGLRAFTTSSGIPAAVSGNPFTSGLNGGVQGILNPLGFYVVADRSANRVGVFRVAGSGAGTTLTAVAGSPFTSGGTFTDAVTQNASGNRVFAANGISRNLTSFSVDGATGALTSIAVQPINTVGNSGLITGITFAGSGLGSPFGDFDGDGKGDLLLRNKSTGQNIGWLMNGLTVSLSAFMPTIADTNWEIRGRGDFNGDGKADVILRNRSTGQNIGWLMNSLTVATSAFMPTIADTNWEIKGVGDFDGDGKADMLLRNKSTGQNIGWLMNGLTVSTSAFMPTIADTNWEIVGVGDLSGDGKADVLLRNKSTGQNIGWLMNGLTVATSAFLPTIADTNWEIKGLGDFNGDGKADVILRNKSTGQNIGWLMDSLTVTLSAFMPTIADTNWEIKGLGDFDGDGKSDVILRNKSTGQNIGWLMNGLVVSTSAFMPTIADTNWEFVGQGQ